MASGEMPKGGLAYKLCMQADKFMKTRQAIKLARKLKQGEQLDDEDQHAKERLEGYLKLIHKAAKTEVKGYEKDLVKYLNGGSL